MVPIINKRIILNEHPIGIPIPGKTTMLDISQVIDPDNVPLNGGVLFKTLVLSLEPFLHAMMNPDFPVTTFPIGESIQGWGIGIVVRSENPDFQVGDHFHALYPFQEYSVQHSFNKFGSFTKVENKHNLPWSFYVGVTGLSGKSAYFGWKEYSHAKKGEVAFVSSGAGAIGSLVIQLAKRDGMKVIASAGSDEKVQFMKELGADVAFNYKTTRTSDVLFKEGPVDVYWDNVGGETLEAALNAAAKHARFIICGMVSTYGGTGKPISNSALLRVIVQEITISGFVVHTLSAKYLESFEREIPALLASNELVYREHVTGGLENAEVTLHDLLKGAFIGKSVVIVGDE